MKSLSAYKKFETHKTQKGQRLLSLNTYFLLEFFQELTVKSELVPPMKIFTQEHLILKPVAFECKH